MQFDFSTIAQNDNVQTTAIAMASGAIGWIANWWKGRERYQALVTWKNLSSRYGEQDFPVIIIQSVHDKPINVTRLRIRNGFRWAIDVYPYDSEDPDYPAMPRAIEPMKDTLFVLSDHALAKAKSQSHILNWFWVPRVYVGVETLGRRERLFVAEGGLSWPDRRRRFRR